MNSNDTWAPSQLSGLANLENSQGITYGIFRSNLKVNYSRSRFSVYLNWIAIFFILFLIAKLNSILVLLTLTVILSLLQHRILLVIHEGAHFLFSKSRTANDIFSNVFSGWFVLNSVQKYRESHLQHHRNLGTPNDPEATYMDTLDLTWMLAAISGLKTLKSVLRVNRLRNNKVIPTKKNYSGLYVPIIGAITHFSICYIFLALINYKLFLIWFLSTYILAPLLGILRNLLEHRYVEAVDPRIWEVLLDSKGMKVREVNLNVTTRIFTQSVLSKFYGSMGFTRHLIHHWDPSISFQNLKFVHAFLLDTHIGPLMKLTDSTYTRAFIALWNRPDAN